MAPGDLRVYPVMERAWCVLSREATEFDPHLKGTDEAPQWRIEFREERMQPDRTVVRRSISCCQK